MRKQTTRIIVVRAVIDHDDGVDPNEVGRRAELACDIDGGFVKSSEVIDVFDESIIDEKTKS